MNIYLKDIDNENCEQCIFQTTNKEGKHFVCEEFVDSNALSIEQSKIQNGWITKAIYDEDSMIRFTMYDFCYEHNFYEIRRIMIDHKYQEKGYGKIALGKVIEEMKKFKDCNEIFYPLTPKIKLAKDFMKVLTSKIQIRLLMVNYYIV